MDVQLIDEDTRKPLAILFEVDNLSLFSKVCEMIVKQVSEVIPSTEYVFMYHGTAICKCQEHVLTIEKTALKSDDPSLHILSLSLSLTQSSTQTEHLGSTDELLGVSGLC